MKRIVFRNAFFPPSSRTPTDCVSPAESQLIKACRLSVISDLKMSEIWLNKTTCHAFRDRCPSIKLTIIHWFSQLSKPTKPWNWRDCVKTACNLTGLIQTVRSSPLYFLLLRVWGTHMAKNSAICDVTKGTLRSPPGLQHLLQRGLGPQPSPPKHVKCPIGHYFLQGLKNRGCKRRTKYIMQPEIRIIRDFAESHCFPPFQCCNTCSWGVWGIFLVLLRN